MTPPTKERTILAPLKPKPKIKIAKPRTLAINPRVRHGDAGGNLLAGIVGARPWNRNQYSAALSRLSVCPSPLMAPLRQVATKPHTGWQMARDLFLAHTIPNIFKSNVAGARKGEKNSGTRRKRPFHSQAFYFTRNTYGGLFICLFRHCHTSLF